MLVRRLKSLKQDVIVIDTLGSQSARDEMVAGTVVNVIPRLKLNLLACIAKVKVLQNVTFTSLKVLYLLYVWHL